MSGMVWPAALSSVAFALMEVIDTAMLGIVGLSSLAGGSLAITITFLIMAFPLYMLRALTPLGASITKNAPRLGSLLRLGIIAPLLLGLIATCLVIIIATALPYLGYSKKLTDIAQTYLFWRAPFLIFELFFLSGWVMLEGLTNTRAPLAGGMAMIGGQIIFNLLLIPGYWGLPALGVVGAALASGLATMLGLAVMVGSFFKALPGKLTLKKTTPGKGLIGDAPLISKFIEIGWPYGLSGLLEVGGWLIIGLIIPRMGTEASATHSIMSQLIALGLAAANGSGIAATVLIAQAMSSQGGTTARKYAYGMVAFQIAIWLVLGGALWFTGEFWATLFIEDQQIIDAGAQLLPSCVAIMGLEGLAIVMGGIIEGTGRTRILLAATLLFDILFGISAVIFSPKQDIDTFYYIWILKSLLKTFFLSLFIWNKNGLSFLPSARAFIRRIFLLPQKGDLFYQPRILSKPFDS